MSSKYFVIFNCLIKSIKKSTVVIIIYFYTSLENSKLFMSSNILKD